MQQIVQACTCVHTHTNLTLIKTSISLVEQWYFLNQSWEAERGADADRWGDGGSWWKQNFRELQNWCAGLSGTSFSLPRALGTIPPKRTMNDKNDTFQLGHLFSWEKRQKLKYSLLKKQLVPTEFCHGLWKQVKSFS